MSIAPAFEAMLLMATEPTATEELAAAVGVPVAEAEEALAAIAAFYEEGARGIRLRRVAGGWRFATDPALADVLEAWLVSDQRSRLTQAALETLAVVAYRQPVTRARVSAVRGVNVDAVMRTLGARGLIIEAGTDADSGATTFATTELFLERLGLTSLSELPELAPLLPDVDVIDDITETLSEEPRFAKLGGTPAPATEPAKFDVDRD